jgi:hypothetical protein
MAHTAIQRLWEVDPVWGHAPWRAAPTRSERVLHVHLRTVEDSQESLCRALASLADLDGYRRVDWPCLAAGERQQAVLAAAAQLRPTLIFMQLQRPGVLGSGTVTEMRRAANSEDLVVISWCGDVGGVNGPFPDPEDRWAYDLSRQCDLMLYTSMSQVRAHRSRGMHNAAYLQIGYDEDRYFEGGPEQWGSRFDACFLGANYDERNWPSLPGNDMPLRRTMALTMSEEFGCRFGLFGPGWGRGVRYLPPDESGYIYRQSCVALSISACSYLERYSSDRLLRALACGGTVLMKSFDDWPSFGFVHEENVLVWDTLDEGLAMARRWLQPLRRDALRQIGRRGAQLAREHHSWGVRMLELWPLIAAVRGEPCEMRRPW